jgi:trimethylamine--corrinoid protein Co-methyltransferase
MPKRYEAILDKGYALEKERHFEKAKELYANLLSEVAAGKLRDGIQQKVNELEELVREKAVYRRIDENAKRVLTDIGMNIAGNQPLMDLLLEADAIDFDNETAPFIPLKREYLERCLELVPRSIPGDPGPNTFGTGATSPFLKREDDDELRPADRGEYQQITRLVAEQQDVVGIFSLPVACDKSISLFEIAGLMEKAYPGLKMITTHTMAREEAGFLQHKEEWLDGTSLIASLTSLDTMVEPFLRSACSGNNLLLIDQTIAGMTGTASPESLLTQTHAQVLFMMIVAQTVNPGILCVHGGIPSVTGADGMLSYSSPQQTMINAAMARVNSWITGYPSAQTGGSTSLSEMSSQAVLDSELSRNSLRKYGVHILRHAMGALGSLNFFSMEKFLEDCERERHSAKIFASQCEDAGVVPLYFPEDSHAFEGIVELAMMGNPRLSGHTLKEIDSFRQWEITLKEAATNRPLCPQLNDILGAAR